jgi:hypothetical protein
MRELTTEQGVDMMNDLVEYTKNALLAGVLKRNIKLAFTNKGVSDELAQKIVDKGENRFNELSHYKAK